MTDVKVNFEIGRIDDFQEFKHLCRGVNDCTDVRFHSDGNTARCPVIDEFSHPFCKKVFLVSHSSGFPPGVVLTAGNSSPCASSTARSTPPFSRHIFLACVSGSISKRLECAAIAGSAKLYCCNRDAIRFRSAASSVLSSVVKRGMIVSSTPSYPRFARWEMAVSMGTVGIPHVLYPSFIF